MNKYIVVGYWDGIGNTLQEDGKMRWFFQHHAKIYINKQFAIMAAKRYNARYYLTRVVVYAIKSDERFSCSDFKQWDKQEGRIAFEIRNH
jgi:hypothetical protein